MLVGDIDGVVYIGTVTVVDAIRTYVMPTLVGNKLIAGQLYVLRPDILLAVLKSS